MKDFHCCCAFGEAMCMDCLAGQHTTCLTELIRAALQREQP